MNSNKVIEFVQSFDLSYSHDEILEQCHQIAERYAKNKNTFLQVTVIDDQRFKTYAVSVYEKGE